MAVLGGVTMFRIYHLSTLYDTPLLTDGGGI
jgi:hypothetical protein